MFCPILFVADGFCSTQRSIIDSLFLWATKGRQSVLFAGSDGVGMFTREQKVNRFTNAGAKVSQRLCQERLPVIKTLCASRQIGGFRIQVFLEQKGIFLYQLNDIPHVLLCIFCDACVFVIIPAIGELAEVFVLKKFVYHHIFKHQGTPEYCMVVLTRSF